MWNQRGGAVVLIVICVGAMLSMNCASRYWAQDTTTQSGPWRRGLNGPTLAVPARTPVRSEPEFTVAILDEGGNSVEGVTLRLLPDALRDSLEERKRFWRSTRVLQETTVKLPVVPGHVYLAEYSKAGYVTERRLYVVGEPVDLKGRTEIVPGVAVPGERVDYEKEPTSRVVLRRVKG